MSQEFREKHGMIVTADAMMYHVDLGKYVFIKRGKEPFKGMLALAGGVVEMNETAEEAIVREVKEETNLDLVLHKFTGYYDTVDRDPRGRTITFVFKGLCIGEPKAGDDAGEIVLLTSKQIILNYEFQKWAFDHKQIIKDVIQW